MFMTRRPPFNKHFHMDINTHSQLLLPSSYNNRNIYIMFHRPFLCPFPPTGAPLYPVNGTTGFRFQEVLQNVEHLLMETPLCSSSWSGGLCFISCPFIKGWTSSWKSLSINEETITFKKKKMKTDQGPIFEGLN